MRKAIVILSAVAVVARAASMPPQAPQAGIVREADGSLRPLFGLPGNLIRGGPLPAEGVIAASFSNEAGLVLIPGALKLLGVDGTEEGLYKTGEGEAILSVSGQADTAIAWMPSDRMLIRWETGRFKTTSLESFPLPGPVIDVQVQSSDAIDLLVRAEPAAFERLQLSMPDRRITATRTYTGITGSALMQGSSLVYQNASMINTESDSGSVNMVPAPEPDLTFARAASGWVHAKSESTHREWMLHLEGSRLTLTEIPAVQPLRIGKSARQ
jgi:hypothetical protein